MAAADRLPDGGAKLRGGALTARQANGSWAAAAATQVTHPGLAASNAETDRRQRFCLNRAYAAAPRANAPRASDLRRSTIERNPLERCGVKCSRKAKRSNKAIASVERMSLADLPE